MNFSDLPDAERDWIDAYIEGTIDERSFESLQDRMLESPGLRAAMRRYLALDSSLLETGELGEESPWTSAIAEFPPASRNRVSLKPISIWPLALAAGLAFFLGIGAMYLGGGRSEKQGDSPISEGLEAQPSAEGFAVIGRMTGVEWTKSETLFRQGDTLGDDLLELEKGIVEIQFFSGATMTVEGPAEVALKSAWEASCLEGAVRMQVPPAARGFTLHSPSSKIIDLGTEFGLVVRDGKGHVEVFDGEIAIQHGGGTDSEELVTTGMARSLEQGYPVQPVEAGRVQFPDLVRLGSDASEQQRTSFKRWRSHRDRLSSDSRLIAHYTFDGEDRGVNVPNLKIPREPELDGTVVLAEPVDGRWAGLKSALEFRRPGARVRVNIPGEFPAFTFACWVRIDSLDRRYNALFMGDGYETGEPHWQIRDDGRMMLSVMVDDTRPNPDFPQDAGFHRVYFSPTMWDLSMSGQWLHLASVFDPANRQVSHYVNGERIHRQEIEDDFFIETLRIGNAEIGNWGQPFREEPTFAIRNLNGRMDEVAVFREALQDGEIEELFDSSRR